MFAGDNGQPVVNLKKGWQAALKRAGIEGVTFHTCRHTFGTRLVMRGVDLVTVAELMGHRTLKMTQRYSHPTPEHKRRAVELLCGVPSVSTTEVRQDETRNEITIGNN